MHLQCLIGFLNYVDVSIFFSSEESTLVLRLHSTE